MEQKLISFCVPSYNSEAYMEKCIDSLLTGGDRVEILIVDDGSKDRTAEIADRYEREHPGIVRAIHQENAGHGGAVNKGQQSATGLYYKVVDSDDWVNEEALQAVLDKITELKAAGEPPEMILVNYVLENAVYHTQNVIRPHMFEENRLLTWDQIAMPKFGEYLMMHSILYQTKILQEHNFVLPEHTFHVDNLVAYAPLTYVKRMYYLNVDFYRYFIGRADQSSDEKMLVKRIDQHIRVNKLMIDSVRPETVETKQLREYLFKDLEIMTTITSVFLMVGGTPEHMAKRDDLWAYLQEKDPKVYKRMKRRFLGWLVTAKDPVRRHIAIFIMRTVRRIRGN